MPFNIPMKHTEIIFFDFFTTDQETEAYAHHDSVADHKFGAPIIHVKAVS